MDGMEIAKQELVIEYDLLSGMDDHKKMKNDLGEVLLKHGFESKSGYLTSPTLEKQKLTFIKYSIIAKQDD